MVGISDGLLVLLYPRLVEYPKKEESPSRGDASAIPPVPREVLN